MPRKVRRPATARAAAPRVARRPVAGETKSAIRFCATLLAPQRSGARPPAWTFLNLPPDASAQLPSRGQTTVAGTLNGQAFAATLQPDGRGGHWLKVDRKLRAAAGAEVGDVVALDIAPAAQEPEPKTPRDLRQALAAAPLARETWSDITPVARRDWIHWIVSAKQTVTRTRRITTACSMLAAGKRRPCCFDRSGQYSRSLRGPLAAETTPD